MPLRSVDLYDAISVFPKQVTTDGKPLYEQLLNKLMVELGRTEHCGLQVEQVKDVCERVMLHSGKDMKHRLKDIMIFVS